VGLSHADVQMCAPQSLYRHLVITVPIIIDPCVVSMRAWRCKHVNYVIKI